MQLGISEILEKVSKLKNDVDKIDTLKYYRCPGLLSVLQGAFDSRVVWLLPAGDPPYKPNLAPETHNVLHSEARKMDLFVKGGKDELKQTRREALFIELLESVHPNDAKILLSIKDKKLPYPGVTPSIVQQAFPGLIA